MINDDFLYISYVALCSLFALLKMKKISLDNFSVAPMAMVHPHIRTPKNWYNRFILGCWTFSLICLLTIISVYQTIVLLHAQNIIYYLVIFCQLLFLVHFYNASCSAWFLVIRVFCFFTSYYYSLSILILCFSQQLMLLIPFDRAPLHFSCIRLSSMSLIVRL